MGREKPGSAAEYLRLRRDELEAEHAAKLEEADREEWIAAFCRTGGSPQDAQAAYKAFMNEQLSKFPRIHVPGGVDWLYE